MAHLAIALSTIQGFVDEAIAYAATHGIQLISTGLNSADGNCIPEAIVDNINSRDSSFSTKIVITPRQLRHDVIEEAKRVTRNYHVFHAMNDGDFITGWNRMETEWNSDDFGDAFPLVAAHCVKKDILVIRVDQNSGSSAFDVYSGELFGATLDTSIPIVLCYNGCHYESLVPVDEESVRQCQSICDHLHPNNTSGTISSHTQYTSGRI